MTIGDLEQRYLAAIRNEVTMWRVYLSVKQKHAPNAQAVSRAWGAFCDAVRTRNTQFDALYAAYKAEDSQ